MRTIDKLRACASLKELAVLLRLKPSDLAYIIHVIPDARKYTEFSIPKKSGGTRTIHAPTPKLKMAQRRLADMLSICLSEIDAKAEMKDRCALSHGFRKGRSIFTNAKRHRKRRFVFNIDLQDFFPSIHFGRIRGFLMKNRDWALQEPVATTIAQIACHKGSLPQGSPCSPIISNLVAHVLDIHLSRFAAANGCTYTRYADDITFSTNAKSFPSAIAMPLAAAPHRWRAGDELAGRIFRSGFRINEQKTRLQYRNSRQDATGLVVNNGVNVPSEYYKSARAMCNNLVTTGKFFISDPISGGNVNQLRGMLSFLFQIRGARTQYKRISIKKGETEKDVLPGFYRIYKQFLDFIYFHSNHIPTIICEGKTDMTHLTNAIKALHAKYPSLVTIKANTKELLVKFFRYSDTSDAVQFLAGGTGDLARLIYGYEGIIRAFSAPGQQQPVIIVVDNDSGATNVWSAIKSVSKTTSNVDGTKHFYHVVRNLYVVPLPRVNGKDTQIEDLYEKKSLSIVINGRTFHAKEGGFDPKIHYPKSTFADEISKRRTAIDFGGFSAILDRIVEVQTDYAARLAGKAAAPS